MNKAALGRLEQLDLRSYWKHESKDFTPWLAEEQNIALLGKAIGMELAVESVEKNVGPFFADILCKDIGNDSWVIIENQIEPTDHSHLGQVLTYAAGIEAKTVIWVAQKFTGEHRAALDWLNEITGEDFNFFGIEIELWRIGDSVPAPKFNVICQPNDWSRSVQASAQRGELTGVRKTQLEFWTGFAELMKDTSKVRCPKPNPQHWMSHRIGLSGCHLDSIASTYDSTTNRSGGELRVELYLDSADAKAHFAGLQTRKDEVERELGEPLTWYNPQEARMCRIYVRRPADINDRKSWPDYYAWLKLKLEAMQRVFEPRVRALSS
jgi:hypothetical protein